jgi:hypothetical protein
MADKGPAEWLDLADALTALRDQLAEAQARAYYSPIRLSVEEVTIEFGLELEWCPWTARGSGTAIQLRKRRSTAGALDAAERALDIFARLHRQNSGSDWEYVVRAYMVTGSTLLEQGEPVPAARALIHALVHALRHNARDLADACYGGIQGAHQVDPSGVAAIWHRMVGSPYPGA